MAASKASAGSFEPYTPSSQRLAATPETKHFFTDKSAVVVLAALFVYHIDHTWPRQARFWLRRLGGKLGLRSDSDGPYVLLAGISAVFITIGTFTYARHHPFPRPNGTYG